MKTLNKDSNFALLEEKLQISFTSKNLLKNAFYHRSYLNEYKGAKIENNERLEFLGDSVLSLIVSEFLYDQLKGPEGQLTQTRSNLVRTETLAKLAQDLSLGEYLFLSKGEEESGGRTNTTIMANTFEALVGAIYLDQGFTATKTFLEKTILTKWQELVAGAIVDHKSKLQEVVQRKYHQSPSYRVLKSWGPDHNRQFEIAVYLNEKLLGIGIGKNKQIAAQTAAKNALTGLKRGDLR